MLSLFYGTISRCSAWSVGSVASRGDTALHWAAYHGHGIVAELLLQHNADIEAKKHDGPRPWKGGRLSGIPRDGMLRGCVSWAVWLDVLATSSASSGEMVSGV